MGRAWKCIAALHVCVGVKRQGGGGGGGERERERRGEERMRERRGRERERDKDREREKRTRELQSRKKRTYLQKRALKQNSKDEIIAIKETISRGGKVKRVEKKPTHGTGRCGLKTPWNLSRKDKR